MFLFEIFWFHGKRDFLINYVIEYVINLHLQFRFHLKVVWLVWTTLTEKNVTVYVNIFVVFIEFLDLQLI